MSIFLSELSAFCIDDGSWLLEKSLAYDSDLVGSVVVPEGFITDFASVPRVPIAFMLFGARAHHESVLHDYLYKIDSIPQVTRKQADDVFLEAMTVRGKGLFVRLMMFAGVRIGGWTAWHQRKVFEDN